MKVKKYLGLLLCSLLLVLGLTACGAGEGSGGENHSGTENVSQEEQSAQSSESTSEEPAAESSETESSDSNESDNTSRKIMVVQNEDITIRFELNDSTAANQLYDMLPMTVEVSNFDTMEKLFHQEGLDLSDAPMSTGELGDLAYYEPTGNVIFYYDYLGPYNGLYALGEAIEGEDQIENLYGTTTLAKE